MTDQEEPRQRPIRYPRRPNKAFCENRAANVPRPRPERPDPIVTEGQQKVRFSYEPELNPLSENSPDHEFFSPEDGFIKIDSADEIAQEYVVPSVAGDHGQHTLTRYFIDPINKILVVFHYNHQDNNWIRTTTRLRKDLPLPQPPVGQFNHNAQQVYGSRGQRYQQKKQEVQQIQKRRSRANRLWRGRSGTTGSSGAQRRGR